MRDLDGELCYHRSDGAVIHETRFIMAPSRYESKVIGRACACGDNLLTNNLNPSQPSLQQGLVVVENPAHKRRLRYKDQ